MAVDDDPLKAKIIKLVGAAKPAPRRRKPQAARSVAVRGNNNIAAGGDVHVVTEKVDRRPRVNVIPGCDVVTEEQKVRLITLVNKWVETNNLTRRTKLSHAAARLAMNRKGGATSYHLIPSERFSAVEKWLLQQIARLNHSATARRKSPTWRAARITAIQARCNERDMQPRRRAYMAQRFGASSMTQLSDADLETLYSAVMSW